MKICFKCGESKPIDDFYKHKKMADGHLNKCKECTKVDMYESRHYKHRDRVLTYDKSRSSRPERIVLRKIKQGKYRAKYPERGSANRKLFRAVKAGMVEKLHCFICGSEKTVAHHTDYSRPLMVEWLCQAHHQQAHAMGAF